MNVPSSIWVHAASAVIPICPSPQVLDVYTTDMGQSISIYRVSQDSRMLIDRGTPIEIWSRWLPICWGKSLSIDGKGIMPEHESITWSASYLQDSQSIRISMNPISGAPPVDFLSDELAMAIISVGLPRITRMARLNEFPEHTMGHIPTPVVMHNNRFHQLSQEVEEIDL